MVMNGEVETVMVNKFYSVNHQLLILEYIKPYTGNGTWKESWHWDIYSVKMDGFTKIRCECKSGSRSIEIPWFQTERLNFDEVVKEICLDKMKATIK